MIARGKWIALGCVALAAIVLTWSVVGLIGQSDRRLRGGTHSAVSSQDLPGERDETLQTIDASATERVIVSESDLATEYLEPSVLVQLPDEVKSGARTLEEEFAAVGRSFCTDAPDMQGLDMLLGKLTETAEVDEGTIATDPHTGVVTGKIRLGADIGEAVFSIDGDNYRVNLDSLITDAEHKGLFMRSVKLNFEADSGGVASSFSSVQFHPDPRLPASSVVEIGEEAFVGWSIGYDGNASIANPLVMRAGEDGVSWEIGKPNAPPPMQNAWPVGFDASQSLYSKLLPFKN